MPTRKALLLPVLITAAALSAGLAGAAGIGRSHHAAAVGGSAAFLGFELKETKEELKLDYDVKVQDNGGGRMAVTFTLADEGRIKPLFAVDVAVPSKDGSGYYDVVLSLAPHEKDGKKIYTLHLTRDLVERGEIDLKTGSIDGKKIMDWGYHRVPFAAHVKAMDAKAGTKSGDTAPSSVVPATTATPATEAPAKP